MGKPWNFKRNFKKKKKLWLTLGRFIVYNKCRFLAWGFYALLEAIKMQTAAAKSGCCWAGSPA
jgi:hypothetical protein